MCFGETAYVGLLGEEGENHLQLVEVPVTYKRKIRCLIRSRNKKLWPRKKSDTPPLGILAIWERSWHICAFL